LVLTEPKVKQNGVHITVEVEKNIYLLCDEIEIEQVFINLINNAVDAIKGSVKPWIKISAFVEGAEIVLRFMDSGNGIPKSIANKIFQPFYTTKAVGSGTGLGLSISKGIIEEHGGSIVINENLGNTCFEIKFKYEEELNYVA
jgi:signal transduction histidine kinase